VLLKDNAVGIRGVVPRIKEQIPQYYLMDVAVKNLQRRAAGAVG
jgi:hypothetical protein